MDYQRNKNIELRGEVERVFYRFKWSFAPSTRPHYLVINADESEPGTVKIGYIKI